MTQTGSEPLPPKGVPRATSRPDAIEGSPQLACPELAGAECARPQDSAGAGPGRDLVLGHDGVQPRFHQTLAGGTAGKISQHESGGRLFGGYTLSEDSRRAQKRRRRQGCGRQDESFNLAVKSLLELSPCLACFRFRIPVFDLRDVRSSSLGH
jgi:hypothetical protein